jgi:hypothetical protein
MADLIAMLSAAASVDGGAAADPNFNQTTLLLHGDGTDGAQNNTFLDSSTNTFTITRNGNTTQGTFSPFSLPNGEWSNYFDGSGDYLSLASNAAFAYGTGDFTWEAWVYRTTTTDDSLYTTMISDGFIVHIISGNVIVRRFGVADLIISSATVSANTWTHIAVARSGTTLSLWINGSRSSGGTTTNSTNFAQNGVRIGINDIDTNLLNGYLSSLRSIKGTALYDPTQTTITVPTSPLTAVSGTSLLTCQSNRFKDNSTNNFAITVNGNPSVQPFSPFAPSAAYSPSVNGASGYFDGSGDGVTTISSAMSYAGDYCIECFFYTNTTTHYACLYSDEASGTGATILLNNGSNNGQITTFGFGASNFASTTTGLNNNAWHHVAITLSGTTLRLFIDGVLENTLLSVPVPGTTTSTVRVGTSFFSGRDFGGYISNFRIVVGSPVYTSTFTPPTAPLTAITNTSLLLLAQNAGIFDNTGKNNLETVGNAQIDTSVKKYGTGSMEFDGTGDYITVPASPNLDLTTGNFTIECWFYYSTTPPSGADYDYLWAIGSNNINGLGLYIQGGTPKIWNNSSVLTTTGSISATTWYHIAVVRSSGTLVVYLDGVSIGSVSLTSNLSGGGSSGFNIARWINAPDAAEFTGYIDDLRITKGVARYTAAFTPPTAAFPDL